MCVKGLENNKIPILMFDRVVNEIECDKVIVDEQGELSVLQGISSLTHTRQGVPSSFWVT